MKARENPFRTERVHAIAHQPVGWSWDDLIARLVAMDYRGAIVGPEGSGKTTLLDDLEPWMGERGIDVIRITLNDRMRRVPVGSIRAIEAAPDAVVMLDGAEQLSSRRWRAFQRIRRDPRGLIVTSHRPGLLPTIIETSTSKMLLHDILSELLRPDPLEMLGDLPSQLFDQHGGNIRMVIRELYEVFAAQQLAVG